MSKTKLALGLGGFLVGVLAIYIALIDERALVAHPKGLIARGELSLLHVNLLLMLIVVVPTFLVLARALWKNRKPPAKVPRLVTPLALWVFPSLVIVGMAIHTWRETHRLDPYKPLEGKQLHIQVVALDWKWLFIYPDEGIATLNYIQFPEKTPIRFSLAADGSPMNSFWIPQLSGQIYAMTGMVTPLYLMADGIGVYAGKAAEMNGRGYASMTFTAKSTTQEEYDAWVKSVREAPAQLTAERYQDLLTPSEGVPVTVYSTVEPGLFEQIVEKYM